MFAIVIGILCMIQTAIQAIESNELLKHLQAKHPFLHSLGITIAPSKQSNASVTICCHGYGSSNRIVDAVRSFKKISDHLIGFNFPQAIRMGSSDEIMPLLYVIKRSVVDAGLQSINLYGFSAGGGAIVNALAALTTPTHDTALKKAGLYEHKAAMLKAVRNGNIVLEVPLKSFDEIIETRGSSAELKAIAAQYKKNNMRPIDVLSSLNDLGCKILIHFEKPDDILGNRDDELFIKRLQAANTNGKTQVTRGAQGGHNTYHATLWNAYDEFAKI